VDEFSATFANLESTRPFSLVTDVPVDTPEATDPVGKFSYVKCKFCLFNSSEYEGSVIEIN
jgi:hypothetical protein